MLWAPVIVFLGVWCTGASSQLVVTQPLSVAEPPGRTVKLSCALSSGYSIDNDRVRWYQQKPGSAPRFVYHYYTSSDQGRGTGIPERFTVSPDTSNNLWNLVISGAQAEDEADYYCYTWDSKQSAYVFGGGTQLTVLGQPKATPTVHLFPPSSEELSGKSKATLVCLMDSFYPGSVQVTWKGDGKQISTGVETTKPSKQSDNKYMASSYLAMSASDWKTHETYTCEVTHDGKNIVKSLQRSQCS